MSKIEQLIERYLVETEEELWDLMARKHSTFKTVPDIRMSGLSKDARDFINSLPEYYFEEIYGARMKDVSPIDYFDGNVKSQWFILNEFRGHNEFLVNTEGTKYARYVARIIR